MSQRIGIFIPDLTGGGAERAMLKLGDGLSEKGYSVDFMVANAHGPYIDQIPAGVRFMDLKAGQPRSCVPALARYMRTERPSAMISALHNANAAALIARKLSGTGTPAILSIQNNFSSERTLASTRRKRLEIFAAHHLYRWADVLAGVSQGVCDDLGRAIPVRKEQLKVLYNPVVSEALIARSEEPIDHPWFAVGQPPVILGVGRLHPQKDFPMLLNAFALVRKRMNARLIILGQGDDRPALEAQVRQLGIGDDVSLPGFADNPYAYMRRSAVFALSSRHEGLPTVLIEALASGCPVVSTDCPDGPREILQGGKFGSLTPVGDPDTFATALISVLEKPKTPPPAESWTPYSHQKCADAFASLIESFATTASDSRKS